MEKKQEKINTFRELLNNKSALPTLDELVSKLIVKKNGEKSVIISFRNFSSK